MSKDQLREFVLKAQNGDREAFESLYQATHALARKIAFSTIPADLVDDAVQESFLLIYRKLPQLREPEAFNGWMARLVLHVCYRMKSKASKTVPAQEARAEKDHADGVVDALALRQALQRLQEKDRNILILREMLQMSYDEIAFALTIPVGTVRSRLSAARKRLSERLAM